MKLIVSASISKPVIIQVVPRITKRLFLCNGSTILFLNLKKMITEKTAKVNASIAKYKSIRNIS